ncbi:TPA: YihY/virulence factor BrkB family protein [Candidatus Poribacteria bacterium]|nr:YihY/virulence factor BrkB family protein [Candidatus Poribacteria bacterium]
MFPKITNLIQSHIWKLPLDQLPRWQSPLIKQVRVFILAFKGFNRDKCQLRAAALTFYSILSLIPVLAMVFGIAQGFGFEQKLELLLQEKIASRDMVAKEGVDWIISKAKLLLESTRGSLIAGVGLIVLMWAATRVLRHIEAALNDIWEIKNSRPWIRNFTDFLSVMVVAPILFILAQSATVFITAIIQNLSGGMELLGYLFLLMKFVPFGLIWLLFTMIYVVVPNTKVSFKSALIAGIIVGTIFQLSQWVFFKSQIGISKYNAIYGSFAFLPLLLIWVQTAWLILLLGAEIAFANQHINRYEFALGSQEVKPSFKKLVTLLITNLLVRNFLEAKSSLTAEEISAVLHAPVRLVRQCITDLMDSKIISEVGRQGSQDTSYQPARSVEDLSVSFVLQAIDEHGLGDIHIRESGESKRLSQALEALNQEIERSPSNMLLKDI